MKLLSTFFLSALGIATYAQGFRLTSDSVEASVGGAFNLSSMVSTGSGSWVAVGQANLAQDSTNSLPTPYSTKAYLTTFSCSSVGSASKRFAAGSFSVIGTVPGGNYIAAGIRGVSGDERAYVCRLNGALDTLSTFDLSQSASDRVYDIVVSSDGSFTAGIVSLGKVFIVRFSPTGAIIWQKEIPNGIFGSPTTQNVQLLTFGTNIYVFSTQSNGNNDDIALHKLDITTGDETFHRTYGSASSHEVVRSVKWQGSEIVVLTTIDFGSLDPRTGLMRLNSSLNSAMSLVFDGGQYLVGAELLTNTDGYSFIGGHISEGGIEYSVVWQVLYNGSVGWKCKLNQYSSVTADMMFEGTNIVVPTSGGMQYGIMMSFVNISSGFAPGACENYAPPAIDGDPYSMNSTPFGQSTLPDAVFTQSRGSVLAAYSGVVQFCSIVLPVEQLYFRAFPEGQKVVLDWATATEHSNDHYTVERSALGHAFEDVTVIDGAGDSQQVTEYRAYDENPLPGTSYYRLRQTDTNGAVSYSDMVAVEFKPLELLVPYPNPATAGNEIRVSGSVTAYDELGRTVATGKDFIVLPVGTYFLRSEDGQKATVVVQ